MRYRAERTVMLALKMKAGWQNGHSQDLPLIDSLEHGTRGWQPRIPVGRISIALDLAPEAARRSQSQIEIVGEFRDTLLEVYVPRYGPKWETFLDSGPVYARIDAARMFAFHT